MVLASAGLTPGDASCVPITANGYTSALVQGTIQSAILQDEQAIDVLGRDDKLHVLVDLGQVRPDEASLVDRGPITAVIAALGAWTGDPRWH
jgi:ABC-type nitrate/sulfonate/bicarbonate transport system substrate-binding protein